MTIDREAPFVDSLYGAVHAGAINFCGLQFSYEATPSPKLLLDLKGLPKGTKVGLETFDPQQVQKLGFKIRERKFLIPESQEDYWRSLTSFCQAKGLEVVHLDDFVTFREYAGQLIEAEKIQKKMEKPIKTSNLKVEDEETLACLALEMAEAVRRCQVEARYIHIVKREEKILENILRFKPALAVIGMGHSDYLVKTGQIKFGRYLREEAVVHPETMYYYGNTITAQGPNPKAIAEREYLLRNWRVVTQGKILPGSNPEYIGTWQIGLPSEGLFEVYVHESTRNGEVTGVIEDCIGTADFTGKIGSKIVRFSKKYQPDNAIKEAAKGNVLYSGQFRKQVCIGEYSFLSGSRGYFTMNAGSNLIIPNLNLLLH
jgi:hypothetical protein